MKKLNITFTTILLVLGCFALSPTVQADPRPTPMPRADGPPIVGLWQVDYTASCDLPVLPPEFLTYQQFHNDRLEIESPSFTPGVCMGTWEQTATRSVQIFHVGWTPGGTPGHPEIVRFAFTETLTVSVDRNSFDGTVDQTFYDVEGNVVANCTATTHATRISVAH